MSCWGTDDLTVYILKGMKFNILLHLKYASAYENVIFFIGEKSNPFQELHML
jgi:hypothetical protein